MNLFNDIYRGKRVFITGHTGFKGSWMIKWMDLLGAETLGYSLPSSTEPSHWDLLKLNSNSVYGDITDREKLEKTLIEFNPDIIFHLAAQSLVKYSYREPFETYQTNVMGTLNVLESARKIKNVKAIVCATTDKVYENKEASVGYKETDRLGGYDPYSSSKACSELLINSYRSSFFPLSGYKSDHNTLLVSVRGGNVIGGGDWSLDRLVPDIVRSVVNDEVLVIRNPQSVRPWQHVLDCLSGYLTLGKHLLSSDDSCSGSWNFGPVTIKKITVSSIVEISAKEWQTAKVEYVSSGEHETGRLILDCSKADRNLNWKPLLDDSSMFSWTFKWYKDYYNGVISTEEQLKAYSQIAQQNSLAWAQ